MELEVGDEIYNNMITLLEQKLEIPDSFIETKDFYDLIKTFSVSEKSVCKVVKSRICCMDWHSSSAKLLLSVGDQEGNIGKYLLWIFTLSKCYGSMVLNVHLFITVFRFVGC